MLGLKQLSGQILTVNGRHTVNGFCLILVENFAYKFRKAEHYIFSTFPVQSFFFVIVKQYFVYNLDSENISHTSARTHMLCYLLVEVLA